MKTREEHIKTTLEPKHTLERIDFEDTFSTTNHIDNLETIARRIFATMPKWVVTLMKLRNYLVKFIGLKHTKPDDYNEEFQVGGYMAFFKIMNLTEKEIIMGANDSHLNFRAIVSLTESNEFNVVVTTLVKYNNTTGKVYMGIVKPFHKIVVRSMVKQAYKKRS